MDWIKLIVVVAAVPIIPVGLSMVFSRLEAEHQGFGPNSLHAIGRSSRIWNNVQHQRPH